MKLKGTEAEMGAGNLKERERQSELLVIRK
jgi:hypothetical protein